MTRDSLDDIGGEVSVVVDGNSPVYVTHHNLDYDGLSTTLSVALATVSGIPATKLVADMTEYVDPDGLDRIFRTRPNGDFRGEGEVRLTIAEFEVRIASTGRIELRPLT